MLQEKNLNRVLLYPIMRRQLVKFIWFQADDKMKKKKRYGCMQVSKSFLILLMLVSFFAVDAADRVQSLQQLSDADIDHISGLLAQG
jgi:hypothetical protein